LLIAINVRISGVTTSEVRESVIQIPSRASGQDTAFTARGASDDVIHMIIDANKSPIRGGRRRICREASSR
jgi:hypothetical protein